MSGRYNLRGCVMFDSVGIDAVEIFAKDDDL